MDAECQAELELLVELSTNPGGTVDARYSDLEDNVTNLQRYLSASDGSDECAACSPSTTLNQHRRKRRQRPVKALSPSFGGGHSSGDSPEEQRPLTVAAMQQPAAPEDVGIPPEPYHKRVGKPVLPHDFLNIPPPADPPNDDSSPSSSTVGVPLPPQRHPPAVPPSLHLPLMEESHYEEAQPPVGPPPVVPRASKLHHHHQRQPVPRVVNGYEVSASQQLQYSNRSAIEDSLGNGNDLNDWRGTVLERNPETGSFYIPSGSGHTTMSSLSPHSGKMESDQNRHNYSLLPGVGTTVPVNVMPLRPQFTGGSQSGGSLKALHRLNPPLAVPVTNGGGGGASSGSSSKPSGGSGRLMKSAYLSSCSWKCLCYCLAVALLTAVAVILYLLFSANGNSGATAVYYPGRTVYGPDKGDPDGGTSDRAGTGIPIRPLPESFDLGDPVVADLPPGVLSYSYFVVQEDSAVQFNLSVEPQAKLVVYGRRTLNPSPAQSDFSQIILGEKLHSGAELSDRSRSKRSQPPYGYKEQNLRQTILIHYLVAGRWHLGFMNDGDQVRTIRFAAALTEGSGEGSGADGGGIGGIDEEDECRYGCYGKGVCKDGKCHCNRGYSGLYCEETMCQVLCSGHGVFTGGLCHCDQGWKGAECDVPDAVCYPLPNCGGRGRCASDGQCVCDPPWTGAACLHRACADANCSGHGVCAGSSGTCYCEFGWRGDACQEPFTATALCPPDALKSACSNHGIWDSILEQCQCDDGWTAKICDVETCLIDCGLHGECIVDKGSVRKCECHTGYTGERCHLFACMDGCEEHGVCNNGTCSCKKGWNGDNCQLDGCPNECNGHGDCVMTDRNWICECHREFADSDCSTPIELECDDNVDNDGDGLEDCADSECCTSSVCSSHHLCQAVREPRMILLQSQPPPLQSSFFQKTRFLLEQDSVQQYSDINLFNESRAAVIRGRVRSPKGGVLVGVRVTDLSNALFGFTLSRTGGHFDLMVNGGGSVTLHLMRSPFGSVYRTFFVPWNQIIYIGDIFMVEDVEGKHSESLACKEAERRHAVVPSVLASWRTARHAGIVGRQGQLLADSRAVYESIRLPGTNSLYLTYYSANAAGYHSNLWLHLLPETTPKGLRFVRLTIDIEGVRYQKTLEARPNLAFEYGWDKRNVYRQKVYGLTTARVSISYHYSGCEEPFTQEKSVKIDGFKSAISDLGGWNLNIHHNLDINNDVLEKGDGSVVYLKEELPILRTTMGTSEQRPLNCPNCNNADRVPPPPPTALSLFLPIAVAAAPDGALFVGDYDLIRRVGTDGLVTTVLKLSQSDTAHPYYLAVHPVSSECYISLPLRRQIWKIRPIDPDAITTNPSTNYEIVVGTGKACIGRQACGDGGAANAAALSFPKGVAFDVKGSLYVADQRSIRVVQPTGLITTLLSPKDSTWTPLACQTFLGTDVNLAWPTALAVDPLNGDLLILDSNTVFRLKESGAISVAIGAPSHCDTITRPDNSTDRPLRLESVTALAIDNDGRILVAESDGGRKHRVRAFDVDGLETLVAGRGSKCACDRQNCPCENADIVLARESLLNNPVSLAIDPAGRIHIADQGNFKIKTVAHVTPHYALKTNQYELFSLDSNEIYSFNRFGQHTSTKDLLSGDYLYNFTYHIDTSYGRLTQVSGSGGHRLYLVRRSAAEVHIENAHGQRSTLQIDQFDKMMKTFKRPDGSTDSFDYDANTELLLSRTEAAASGGARFYDYDRYGYATKVVSPSGDVYVLEKRVGEGNRRVLVVLKNGAPLIDYASSARDLKIKGANEHLLTISEESIHLSMPGGRIRLDRATHALLAPHDATVLKEKVEWNAVETRRRPQLTAKLEWRFSVKREATKVVSKKTIVQVGRKPRVNGINVMLIRYDRKAKTDTILDQNGDEILHIHYNHAGLVEQWRPSSADLAPLNNSYDSLGQLKEITWGPYSARFVYDRHGRLTDSSAGKDGNLLLSNNGYASSDDVWPSTIQIPSGPEYRLSYDKEGGLRSVVTPNDEQYTFAAVADFGSRLLFRFVPFSRSPFLFLVDNEQRLPSVVVFPGGVYRVNNLYDAYGRLERQLYDGRSVMFSREAGSGRLLRVGDGTTFGREFVYQGDLVIETTEKRLGVYGSVARFNYFYDNQFRVTQIRPSLSDNSVVEPILFEYERRSGRLKRLKQFNFQYAGPTVRIMSDNTVLERIYSATKLLTRSKLSIGGRKVIERSFAYDEIGRVRQTTTDLNGRKTTSSYTYSVDGYLNQLTTEAAKRHRWTLHYDLDNRLKAFNDNKLELSKGGLPVKFGDTVYFTDSAGFVIRRGDDNFGYDSEGRLIRAWKEGDYNISYTYDERNRLISRRSAMMTVQFYYALVAHPNLVTHIQQNDGAVSVLFYDEDSRIFAAEVGGARYLISTLPDGSPDYVFSAHDGAVHQSIVRDALGRVVLDSNAAFWMPVGYRGHFQDPDTGVVIIDGRPLDTMIGRWMSISVDAAIAPLDVYKPESVDFFSTGKATAVVWPNDAVTWLRIAGLDIMSIAPLLNLAESEVYDDPTVFLCPKNSPAVHGVECDVWRKLRQFRQFNSFPRSKIVARSPYVDATDLQWSTGAAVFGRGVSVTTDGGARAIFYTADLAERSQQDTMIQLLNRTQLLPLTEIETAPIGSTLAPFLRRHFWKADDDGERVKNDLEAIGVTNGVDGQTSLSPGVNLTAAILGEHRSKIEIQSDLSSAVIHYGGSASATLEELRNWMRAIIRHKFMLQEQQAIRFNRTTRFDWSAEERQQLRSSTNPIDGVVPIMKERFQQKDLAELLVSDPNFYEFERKANTE